MSVQARSSCAACSVCLVQAFRRYQLKFGLTTGFCTVHPSRIGKLWKQVLTRPELTLGLQNRTYLITHLS